MLSFARSELLLERALKRIPLGAQTFSKSHTQYPRGVSPYFADRARGARLWDVDGNEYVDMVSALAAVTLGYCDPDVDAAVRAQLDRGVSFTLSTGLEIELAEAICALVPCAEMVRFGKNGSDATAACVRVARAHTGRDRVAVCGYHGWQDWYIGSTARARGVPAAVRGLTHTFAFNDLDSLERALAAHSGEFAAVVMEPMNVRDPAPGFLAGVRDLAHRHGALLVFDEVITGFRFADGGAQQLFGVTPDLVALGKGMANGYPLSAVAGRADVMKLFEEVFYSFTYGGEALSLAAGIASLGKLVRDGVCAALARRGEALILAVRERIARHGVGDFVEISGHPSWTFLSIKDAAGYGALEIKTLFLQEMFQRGVLTVGTHNLSFAHGDAEFAHLLKAYDEVFPLLRAAVAERRLGQYLRCRPLEPLFKVR